MKTFNSPDYYKRREQEARDMAARASFEDIREIHLSMAERYLKLAEMGDAPIVRTTMALR